MATIPVTKSSMQPPRDGDKHIAQEEDPDKIPWLARQLAQLTPEEAKELGEYLARNQI